jgi:hypothetical protein
MIIEGFITLHLNHDSFKRMDCIDRLEDYRIDIFLPPMNEMQMMGDSSMMMDPMFGNNSEMMGNKN